MEFKPDFLLSQIYASLIVFETEFYGPSKNKVDTKTIDETKTFLADLVADYSLICQNFASHVSESDWEALLKKATGLLDELIAASQPNVDQNAHINQMLTTIITGATSSTPDSSHTVINVLFTTEGEEPRSLGVFRSQHQFQAFLETLYRESLVPADGFLFGATLRIYNDMTFSPSDEAYAIQINSSGALKQMPIRGDNFEAMLELTNDKIEQGKVCLIGIDPELLRDRTKKLPPTPKTQAPQPKEPPARSKETFEKRRPATTNLVEICDDKIWLPAKTLFRKLDKNLAKVRQANDMQFTVRDGSEGEKRYVIEATGTRTKGYKNESDTFTEIVRDMLLLTEHSGTLDKQIPGWVSSMIPIDQPPTLPFTWQAKSYDGWFLDLADRARIHILKTLYFLGREESLASLNAFALTLGAVSVSGKQSLFFLHLDKDPKNLNLMIEKYNKSRVVRPNQFNDFFDTNNSMLINPVTNESINVPFGVVHNIFKDPFFGVEKLYYKKPIPEQPWLILRDNGDGTIGYRQFGSEPVDLEAVKEIAKTRFRGKNVVFPAIDAGPGVREQAVRL